MVSTATEIEAPVVLHWHLRLQQRNMLLHFITAIEVLVFSIGVFVHTQWDGYLCSCKGTTMRVILANVCG